MRTIFKLLELIEKGVAASSPVTVIDKSGKFLRGDLYDHYVRFSAEKLRGKIQIRLSKDNSEVEVDVNDILDIQF